MTLADRVAVMDHGQHHPGGDAGGDLRAAELALRRRLHRRHQPPRREGRGKRRRRGSPGKPGDRGGRRGRAGDRRPRPAIQAWFAIRPEKIGISLDAPADATTNCVAGEVWDIGYLGDVSIYHVRLATGATMKSTVTNRTRLVERPITWDDKVWLSWQRDAGVVLTE